ncbi:MAG: ABC transporter substrate-binding protein [Anaerolineae bacterium]|nr:ABC transporter substrate-binding protein [Anaerolineae bacterium]
MHHVQRSLSLLMVTLSLLVGACTNTSEVSSSTRRIVYGLTLSVSGIDPHINQNSELGIVLRQVYDTLVYRDPTTKEIVPGLASSWQISDDGLVYTFRLRPDVVFHDGTVFNANAVAANLDRITNSALNSQRARLLLGPYAGYQIIDDFNIRIILSQPFSPLLDSLAQVYLGMASPKALAEYAEDTLRYQFHQVGSGPFIFVEYVPEDRIVIRRNPKYAWGPSFYGSLPDNAVEEVEFRFFRDPSTRAAALLSGDAHIMGELLPADARSLSGNPSVRLLPTTVPGQPLQFYFNTRLVPTDSLAIRQAILYASNRTAIVDAVYQGFSPVAWGPLSAATLFYNPGVVNAYAHDKESARRLLSSAGYADSDNDGLLDLAGQPLQINVIQPPWGLVPQVVQLLQDQWRSVGIQANIVPVPGFVALLEKIREGNWHMVAFDAFGYDPALLDDRFKSNGVANWTGYASSELDALLEQARQAQNPSDRQLFYGQAQSQIMQNALILPIRDYVNINAHVSSVEGLIFDPYGWFPLLYGVRLNVS